VKRILIIAGEASSDMHAANLVRNIKTLDADISFFGLGGDKMKEAGVDLLENILHLAFIGPGGLFKHYLTLRKIYGSLCAQLTQDPPDCAILIDYAEFNLRVAKHLKSLGVRVIYFISPQVWAWGLWRVKTIRRLVDRVLVLFKFEEELYKAHGVDVAFVGHPLLDMVKTSDTRDQARNNLGISGDAKLVGILPGSRIAEIKNMLPVMLAACEMITKKLAGARIEFILPLAPTIDESCIREFMDSCPLNIKVVKDHIYDGINACDCAMVTSGTATLETALLGVPMAIIYKTNFLTYFMTKNLITLPYIGLVNVVAGENLVPEFLQHEADPAKISEYMIRLLTDRDLADSMRKRFLEIKDSLGAPGASRRAASQVIDFLSKTQ